MPFSIIPDSRGISGQDLPNALKAHLDSMEIPITEDRVASIYAMGDYFAIQGGREIYEATTVILSTGVVAGKPLPGEVNVFTKVLPLASLKFFQIAINCAAVLLSFFALEKL